LQQHRGSETGRDYHGAFIKTSYRGNGFVELVDRAGKEGHLGASFGQLEGDG
jgi:hypothetical protein